MSSIHPTAVIDEAASVADNVTVGPYAVIGPDVEIAEGTWIGPHAVVQGPARIGRDNRIFQFASVGEEPQDKKFRGERTRLEIGDGNTIRECVTINRGTGDGGGVTRIGDDNWIMAYCHIAHDCLVASHTVFANNASLAGHVEVADHVILGGFSLVHQFSRLGEHCFLAFGAHVDRDVPPFVMAAGQRATPRGLNVEGLKRNGFPRETTRALKQAYKTLYREGLRLEEAINTLETADDPMVARFAAFVRASERGIIR
ncbi:acyl-ACP--UDP-N-acetylglucosamine O-acyltransferase [Arhodomonas sp. AD133]|uniref:acyl-ACP--UDP-N-acetylglucosamine O-acyltransferase n=1 Tax=Arhodomonas sp. AD133 TaxID=3415009 RepID=UPI003EBF89A3